MAMFPTFYGQKVKCLDSYSQTLLLFPALLCTLLAHAINPSIRSSCTEPTGWSPFPTFQSCVHRQTHLSGVHTHRYTVCVYVCELTVSCSSLPPSGMVLDPSSLLSWPSSPSLSKNKDAVQEMFSLIAVNTRYSWLI